MVNIPLELAFLALQYSVVFILYRFATFETVHLISQSLRIRRQPGGRVLQ